MSAINLSKSVVNGGKNFYYVKEFNWKVVALKPDLLVTIIIIIILIVIITTTRAKVFEKKY